MGSVPADRRLRAHRVCIIGAGPSGLAAAKYLLAEKAFSQISIFEQRATAGGLWNYVQCDKDSLYNLSVPQTNPHAGLHQPIWGSTSSQSASFMSPLYDRLETNIPRGLMGFSDLDWDPNLQLFPTHGQVLDYINQYADDVRHLIQFKTQVIDVSQTKDQTWRVTTQPICREPSDSVDEHIFDAIIVASGHFDVPHIPHVPGIEAWHLAHPGRISHSKFFRKPEHFAGKKVVVVGNAASGSDIASQIQAFCELPLIKSKRSESLFLSDKSTATLEKPQIVEYIADGRSIKFEDGTVERDVDAIVYCTGYFYSFPFLKSLEPPLVTAGHRTENLYQHLFWRPQPTLSFLVLNQKVIPFPFAEVQSAVVARVLSGRLALPSDDTMQAWERETIAARGDSKVFHVLNFPEDADHINMLHDWALSADVGEPERGTDDGLKQVHGPAAPATVGKPPPYWGEKERWMRAQFPKIKKAWQDLGKQQRPVRTLEALGFDYEQWKREQRMLETG